MPQQLTLHFTPRRNHARSDFHVGDANRAALEAIGRWPDWPSRVMVLVGPAASGKSHMVSFVAQERSIVPKSAGDIDWQQVAAQIAARGVGELVVIEDMEPGFDEAGLFHLINATASANGWLLLTSRLPPSAWQVALPDLASRLRAATPLVIGPPDDALLEAVMAKHFADRQTIVDPGIIRYSLARMERTFAAAQSFVAAVDTLAMSRNAAITRALVAEVLHPIDLEPRLPGFEDVDGHP